MANDYVTEEQVLVKKAQFPVPPPPKEPPPAGMNRVYKDGAWVDVPNPVAGIIA